MLEAAGVPATEPRSVFGINFSSWTADRLVDTVLGDPVPDGEGLRLLVTANLDHIVQLTSNAAFGDAYRDAWLAVVDGTPVYLYARLRGVDVPGRVTGSDLAPAILRRLEAGQHRPLLVVSSEATAGVLRETLEARGFGGDSVIAAPPDFERDATFSQNLIATAQSQRTTHLFFGLGAPKSEIWMHRHRRALPSCYGFAFGAGLDFYAGTKRRAPRLMRRIGAEFLWRVLTEPRRLARRYFVSSWTFLRAVARDLRGQPIGPGLGR